MSFTLKQVHYFLAAAESGQFSSAAAKVHVTQSAMTVAMRELEAAVGFKLFLRQHASGVQLTPRGHHFLEHARSIAASARAAVCEPGESDAAVSGRVRLVASHAIYGYYLVPAIARFTAFYRAVDLQVLEMARCDAEKAVVAGEADIAVLRADEHPSPGLTSGVLTRSRRQLWLAAGHPLLDCRQLLLSDVAKEPYALLDADEMSEHTQRLFARQNLRPDIRFKMSSIEAVRSLVAQGLAVTVLSDVAYRPFSREGQRIEARPLDSLAPVDIGLFLPAEREPNAAVTAFRLFLERTFSTPGWNAPSI